MDEKAIRHLAASGLGDVVPPRWALERKVGAASLRYLVYRFRRWLFARWLRRHRYALALIDVAEEHLSESGRQIRKEAIRELEARRRPAARRDAMTHLANRP